MNENENNDFDTQFDELDSLDTHVKINPTFYIHLAILKAQNILSNPNVSDNILPYFVMVEHLEALAKASGVIGNDTKYDEEIASSEKTDLNNKLSMGRLANKKFKLIVAEFFKSAPMRSSLNYSIRKSNAPNETHPIPNFEKDDEIPPLKPEENDDDSKRSSDETRGDDAPLDDTS